MSCYSRALGRLSQIASCTATYIQETASSISNSLSNSLDDCGGKICKVAKSSIKKLDEWVGFVDPMVRTAKSLKEKDYRGVTREAVNAVRFYPRMANAYLCAEFTRAYLSGETFSTNWAIPLALTSYTLSSFVLMLDALEAQALQKELKALEQKPLPLQAFIGKLKSLTPMAFERLLSCKKNTLKFSALTNIGQRAIKNHFSTTLTRRFRFNVIALVSQIGSGYLSIRQGNHQTEVMNKQLVVLSVTGTTLVVIAIAETAIKLSSAKKLKQLTQSFQRVSYSGFNQIHPSLTTVVQFHPKPAAPADTVDVVIVQEDSKEHETEKPRTETTVLSLKEVARAYEEIQEEAVSN